MIRKFNFMFCEQSQPDAFEAALVQMVGVIQNDSSIRHWVWLIPQKAQLQGDSLIRALNKNVIKALASGEPQHFNDNVVQLKTKLTWSRTNNVDGVIAFYADQGMMDLIDENGGAKAVIAVPYAPGDIENWRKAWQPVGPGGVPDRREIIDDAVVVVALTELTDMFGSRRSSLHPRDAESVSDVFKILRVNGHLPNPSDVRAWCVGHGWRPSVADEVMKRATRILGASASARPKPTTRSATIYDRWRKL